MAIVTGGGGNIGSATVLMLARAGARVIAADINQQDAERSADSAKAIGADAVALGVDTRNNSDIGRMVSMAIDRWVALTSV